VVPPLAPLDPLGPPLDPLDPLLPLEGSGSAPGSPLVPPPAGSIAVVEVPLHAITGARDATSTATKEESRMVSVVRRRPAIASPMLSPSATSDVSALDR
jgi:hypothetical protein